VEFTQTATARLSFKNRSKWLSSGRQLPVIQRQSADPACAISSASASATTTNDNADSKLQLYQVRPWPKHRKRKSNRLTALIGHRAYAAWKIVHAALAHSGTVPLNWRKLTPI